MRMRSNSWVPLLLCLGCYSGPLPAGDATDGSGGSEDGGTAGTVGTTTNAGTMGTTTSTTTSTEPTSTGSTGATESADSTGEEPPVEGPLLDRLEVTDVELPEGVKAGVSNWRIWGTGPLLVAPVFTVPLANCGTLVGLTTGAGSLTARVAVLDADDALVEVLDLASGLELRGLAAEDDGHFGALVWDDAANRIWVRRYDLTGAELSSTELTNADNDPTDFGIGDSRLEHGGGTYGAYYHVHSLSGHEGDTLKWVAADTGMQTTGWAWGCSHSMSNLLRWNAAADRFLPVCVTDCYPGTSGDFATNSIGGVYLDHSQGHVIDVDAGCNGSVAGELGGAAPSPDGWALVFNAHQAPATPGQGSYDPGTMNQDVALSMISGTLAPGPVVWLTDTAGIDEDDASIARWEPAGDDAEQYVVGWHERDVERWLLARIDPAGALLEGPVDVGGVARWGRRDDPFREHYDGDVMWAWFDAPGSTTLHVARLRSGGSHRCAPF
ncbi:hypothetical protein [Paraliomyxa miuraensis]|uniref:hypothetical protein n=1 Tax=Paraliomyxa miuraensis TaxID=376150 RepID=UPI0022532CD4|nr:hypothetical protein [Paraliomyxa miuraensis]MCX4245968.1 hypothetical protein [Paraliomyxa miuraensis]